MDTILITLGAAIAVSFLGILLTWLSKKIRATSKKEGFEDKSIGGRYTNLQKSIATQMKPYCDLSNTMQARLKTILQQMNNLSSDDADKQVKQTLKTALKGKEVLPCSIYQLPTYKSDADKAAATEALLEIPDDIASRISLEVKLYADTLNQLQGAIDGGMNPPTTAPSAEDMKKIEGFEGKTCSANALKLKKQKELELEAASCSVPDLDSQITRVTALFQNPDVQSVLKSTNSIFTKLAAYEINEKKMKDGTLFPWQQDNGPKKSYTEYKGGDNRAAALVFSMSSAKS
uniref:Uncharacterized protein n=1 Tax=viral metagenome TaxID=1070528 RepID=A0A6C0KCB0_9ZZZZ